jgi:hypothetical protein
MLQEELREQKMEWEAPRLEELALGMTKGGSGGFAETPTFGDGTFADS